MNVLVATRRRIASLGSRLDELETGASPETRLKAMKKTGRMMKLLLTTVRVFLIISMTVTTSLMAVSFFYPGTVSALMRSMNLASTVNTITASGSFGLKADISLRNLMLIELFAFLLAQILIRHMAGSLKQIFSDIAEDGSPFEAKNVKRFRMLALEVLLFSLWNLPVALMLSTLSFVFSQIFSYGVYLQERADENSRIQEEVILSFAEITEAKSGQTGQHVRRVAEYSKVIALALGMSGKDAEILRIAAMMHDVGKLIIPVEILDKPGGLTDEEYRIIKTHTGYGDSLLAETKGNILRTARAVASEHHEKWDGTGYHRGLKGGEISLPARIVAVADVFDALTSRRSYKEPWDPEKAYAEIIKGSGTSFDPRVVSAFAASYDKINEIRIRYSDPDPDRITDPQPALPA